MYFAAESSTLLPWDAAFHDLKAVELNINQPGSGKIRSFS